MDILKKVHSDPSLCQINATSTIVNGKEIDDSQLVTFASGTSKKYSIRSILFFLLNPNKALKEYVTLCKTSNVSPISHVDKATILNEIGQYESVQIKGFFVQPSYTEDREYEMATIQNRNVIVIPQSFTSKIHLGNVEDLLVNGRFIASRFNPLTEKSTRTFRLRDSEFEAINSFSNVSDLNRVLAVFIEHSDERELQEFLNKCPRDTLLITLKKESFSSLIVELSGNTVKNQVEIADALTTL